MKKILILAGLAVFFGKNAYSQIPKVVPVSSKDSVKDVTGSSITEAGYPTLVGNGTWAMKDSIWYDTVRVRLLISDSCNYNYRLDVGGAITKIVDWKIYPMMGYAIYAQSKYSSRTFEGYLDDKKKPFTACKEVW